MGEINNMDINSADPDVSEAISNLEKELELPDKFFIQLVNEDDWSFVIKAHSLLESAINYLLEHHFDDQRLIKVLSALPLGHKKTGKLAFVASLKLLESDDIRFISSFSQIRNRLIHQLKNVTFEFKEHVSSLRGGELNEFVNTYGYGWADRINVKGKFISKRQFISENPKISVYFTLLHLLAFIYLKKETILLKRQSTELQLKYYELAAKAV